MLKSTLFSSAPSSNLLMCPVGWLALAAVFSTTALAQIDWAISNPTLTGAAYGNGTYVLAEQTGWFWASQDMTNWIRRPSPVSGKLSAVVFGKGAFVAVGVGTDQLHPFALISTNGVEWSGQMLEDGANPLHADTMNVQFINNHFVATGGFINVNASFGGILTSPDGITWKTEFVAPLLPGGSPGPGLYGAAYGNGKYIAVGGWQQHGPPYAALTRLVTSVDGQTWSVADGPTAGIFNDVAFGNGVFVAVGGAAMETLTDGGWQPGPPAGALRSLVYGNGRFVAVGNGGAIQTSDDGFHWTNRVSGTSVTLRRVALAQKGFLAVGDSGTLVHSPDGADWTVMQSSYIFLGIGGIAYGNGMFVASSAPGAVQRSQSMLRSNNGFGWASTQVRTNIGHLGAVAYGAGKFAVIGYNSSPPPIMYTSSDALTWNAPNLPTDHGLSALGFANGLFLAGGVNGPLMTSPDAETWTIRNAEDRFWAAFTYGNGGFLALANPPFRPGCDPHYYNCASGPVTAALSPDGVVWTMIPTTIDSLSIFQTGLAFGKGVFVVAAAGGQLFSSTDGVHWHRREVPGAYTSVIYANGAFVAVGVGNLATSLDGETWKQRPVTFTLTQSWDGPAFVTYGNNLFLTICGSGWVGVGAEVQTSASIPFLEASKTGRHLKITASSGPLETFSLQASTDLKDWRTLTNLPSSAAELPLTDLSAANSTNRYYRIAGPDR